MTLDINYTTTNPRKVDQLLETAIESVSPINTLFAFPFTSEGIQAAIDALYAKGQPGVVTLASEAYSITSDITLRVGISLRGILGKLDYIGYVPDQNPSPVDGTIFNVSAGVTALKYNNIDQPNPAPAELADTAGTSINISGITFVGGLRAIHTGAKNILGLHYASVKNCRFFNQTAEHYIFENFMHMQFENLWAWNNINDGSVHGGCVFRASRLRDAGNAIALLPGNSVWTGTIFGWTNQYLIKGISFEGIDGQLNECSATGARLQFNRYPATLTARDVVLTSSNGSSTFTVSDPAQFALCQVGMPLAIPVTSAAVGVVSNGGVYFVSSRNPATNEITLNEFPEKFTSNLVANSNGPVTLKCGGFAGINVIGNDTGVVTAMNLGDLDIECKGNVAGIVARNAKFIAHILEMMPSDTDTAIVPRNCDMAITYVGPTNITNDTSTNHGSFRATNLSGGSIIHYGGSFTLNTSHSQQIMRYHGASDIVVTYPRTLPKGFQHKTVCTSTGQVTYTGGAGASAQNRSASAKTAGGTAPQANLELLSVASGGAMFHLWGDLGG